MSVDTIVRLLQLIEGTIGTHSYCLHNKVTNRPQSSRSHRWNDSIST